MPRPALIIRLTHTGVYADGRPNVSPVQVTDLDVGYENQHRKVPVYVPPAGHIDINASSRSMLSFEQGGIDKFTNAGLLQSQMFYIPESYTTGTLPAATDYPAGVFVWNTTEETAYWSTGVGWATGKAVPTGPAGGDLGGTYPNPVVTGIQTRPVSGAAPAVDDALVWNGLAWAPNGGGLAGSYKMVATAIDYTAAPWDIVLVTTTAGKVIITLPLATSCSGKPINIKKVSNDGNVLEVEAQGAELIDGQANYQVTAQYVCQTVVSDGTNWWII